MDPDVVREWKRGYDELNHIQDEEQRSRTSIERLIQIDRIWLISKEMGIVQSPNEFDVELNEKWNDLRRSHLERNRPHSN